MRIAGAFTQGQKPFAVSLPSGGVWYPPAGNYIVSLGTNSTVQVWDGQALQWRNVTPTPGQYLQFDSDGINWRITNVTGQVLSATVLAAGSGGTNGIGLAGSGVLTIAASASFNNAAGFVIVGGALGGGITVTAAGAGYTVPPIIVIDAPPIGGVQATAIATITAAGGGIATATVVNAGAGYTTVPQIWVLPQYQLNPSQPLPPGSAVIPSIIPPGTVGLPPPGTHAFGVTGVVPVSGGALLNWTSATPLAASSGTVTGIVITNGGGGYSGTVTPTIAGAGAATSNPATLGAAGATDTSYLWPAITA